MNTATWKYGIERIKAAITCREVLERAGVKIRGNRFVCEWRGGEGLSGSIFADGRLWTDHAGNDKGSVIDLYARIHNAAGKNSIDRASGAGVFARDPDALLALTESNDSSDEEPVFVIEPTVREFPPQKGFAVRWKFPLWIRDDRASTELKGGGGRPRKHTLGDLVQLIGDPSGNSPETTSKDWEKAAHNEGISRSSFFEMRRELEQAGMIEKANEKWRLSKKGLDSYRTNEPAKNGGYSA